MSTGADHPAPLILTFILNQSKNFAIISIVERHRRLFYSLYVNERGIMTMTELYSVLAFVLLLVAFAKVIEDIKK